jgi:Chitinase class I
MPLSRASLLLIAVLSGCAQTPTQNPPGGTGGAGGSDGTGGSGGSTGGSGGRGGTGGSVGGSGGTGGRGGTGGSGGNTATGGSGGSTADARPIDARPDLAPDVPRDTGPPPPPAGCGFTTVVSKAAFDGMFPSAGRNAIYNYEGLVTAAMLYPSFVATMDANTCKKEAAAFLANVAHETDRLRHAEEVEKMAYCDPRSYCPCDPNDRTRWFYGRGPLQITWSYNYCAAGVAIGAPLGTQPGLVSSNGEIAWKTALWFWMTQRGAGTSTAHEAITGTAGFGGTISSLNGALECNRGGYSGQPQVKVRVDYYLDFARRLGVTNPGTPQDNDC